MFGYAERRWLDAAMSPACLCALLFLVSYRCVATSANVEPGVGVDGACAISVELASGVDRDPVLAGSNVTLTCQTNCSQHAHWWAHDAHNVTNHTRWTETVEADELSTFNLHVTNVSLEESGNYTCHVARAQASLAFNVSMPVRIVAVNPPLRVRSHDKALLHCVVEGYPLARVSWLKDGRPLAKNTIVTGLGIARRNVSLKLVDVGKRDGGNYSCVATDASGRNASQSVALLLLDKPQVRVDRVKALGATSLYLNWTVHDGNDPEHLGYSVQYMADDTSAWYYYPEQISGTAVSVVLENSVFKADTGYSLRMEAYNAEGSGQKSNVVRVRTLAANPEFVPDVKVTGVTVSSVTIAWALTPVDVQGLVHYYQLKLWAASNGSAPTEAIHSAPSDNLYMFRDLVPATTYQFQVAACSEYTRKCSPWSAVTNATTLDGIAEPPENVTLECHKGCVHVTWEPPKVANGRITHYNVVLEGATAFLDDKGNAQNATWGPKMTSVSSDRTLSARFYNVSANTNYTAKISAVTRTKKHGKHMVLRCAMAPAAPDRAQLALYSWAKLHDQDKWMFRLYLPRISERNGAICCYRVYIIRLEANKGLAELSSPEELHIGSYQEAHRTPKGGAYVAEMFSSEYYQPELFLGDEQVLNYTNSPCMHCTGISSLAHGRRTLATPTPTSLATTTTIQVATIATADDGEQMSALVRRHVHVQRPADDAHLPYDGVLDISSNYTGFVEIVVYGGTKDETLTAYSSYLGILQPGPELLEMAPATQMLGVVVQIFCVLILVVLVLLAALCMLNRYTKHVAHAQGIEMMTFRNSFRHLCRSFRGRHRLVSLSPPDMSPIERSELATVYEERHRDSDYGFQREFELLPDRFADRTAAASETRENAHKNRYPDIKAYDQTRVRLTQVDSGAGSDYINANFVVGYRERKRFICAQGPMDSTVCDFWRMIWEQRLELVLMLTNLEEYSKTKCSKYWPDKPDGDKLFGDIAVAHVDEKRYSDYVVRQLRIARTNNNANGKAAGNKDERLITQYHYLVWKDFMAPEHPHGILKFVKRMNEAHSPDRGSILVHCSAGVGRTGTLVALDSLLQQLAEEGQVAIFNTVCDLRHQRNFLVQSLKQYIFIYRALIEIVQYGDTEVHATALKSTIDRLRQIESGKSRMEEDYEKIRSAVEERKSVTVGGGDENAAKNRSELIIPYDRNRVILTPVPAKEHSTYINASFVEGYDNSESFIVTQDPLEQTIADFWRMVAEQGVVVVVMLSNLGDGARKCPRYWPDDEAAHDHVFIKHIQSESCPYYTRRELVVTNRKSDESTMVTQLQYHGWPTVEGEVPEVTRGLIELVDQVRHVQEQQHHDNTTSSSPIVVHCNYGSDRSSMFVGLTILVQQLRLEKRVDVFAITRKLRSQRQGMISTFAQYEFLHRAILNYAELHQLCDGHADAGANDSSTFLS